MRILETDGEAPPKKTPSKKSKGKSKKNIPKPDEEPKEEVPPTAAVTHEPVVLAESAMPPPQPTPSVGQLQMKPRVRDFWVCWGLLFIFALVCGIGFAILHTTKFLNKGQDKWFLMQANREEGTHGAILDPKGKPTNP